MKNKSLMNVLKALPQLVSIEHTRGFFMTIIKQWGKKNAVFIVFNILRKTGLIGSVTSLLKFRLDKLMPNLLISMWDVFGDREAIISGDKRISYKDLKVRVFRLANGLKSLGLRPKDKFAELLYNGNEFFEAFLAGSLIGCPMPFLNWHIKGEELAESINRASPRVLILHEEFVDNVISIRDRIKTVEHFVVVGEHAPDDMILYEDLISQSSDQMPETNFILALNPYTGGTTGVPKNVNYFDAFGYAFSNIADAPRVPFTDYLRFFIMEFSFPYWFGGTKIKDPITHNMRCLIPGPLYHAGVIVAWAPFLLLGGTGVPMKEFDPEEFLKVVEKERINWVFVVPTMLERILDLPDEVKAGYDLSSMKSLICAAAPASPELKQAINKFFIQQGCKENVFKEYYGSAETSIVTILLPEDYEEKPKRYASVGKIRCGELKIYDGGTGQWCLPGKEGKVLSRTVTTVSLQYAGTPEKLESAFNIIDGVSWFDDGLLGYLDEDGFLYLTGREKEMIISGGVNVFPNEIEAVITKKPKVFDVAVIRHPDADLGEVPAAIIQLRKGEQSSTDEIIEHCKKNGLRGIKLPKVVEFIKELPRRMDGKLLKRELEDKYWEGIERRG
ncbi:MAG: AMP-binding protein [Thermodesulfobacteriota bacterium]|nr:AMP-binding protein [Thermodesulfobacteriota bacterium]